MEEMLYHVNRKDEVLGEVSRSEAHSKVLLHRAGMVFLMNSENKVLLNMRSSEKKTFPSCYDSSVSFHVGYGEKYIDAAMRETEEEIKIKALLRYIGNFIHRDPPEYQIVYVFLCKSEKKPTRNSEEFSSGEFYSIEDAEKIIQNENITPWLREGWKNLIRYLKYS